MLANVSTTPQPTTCWSLIISPNLDALLEHEERVRSQDPPSPGVPSPPASPVNHLGKASYPAGLPPPPRGNRGPKTPKSPGYDGEKLISPTYSDPSALWAINNSQRTVEPRANLVTVQEVTSSSSTNPYINPAPTLDDLGQGKESKGVAGDGDRRLAGEEECQIDGCDGGFGVGRRPSCLEQRRDGTSQRSQLRAVSLLVEKRLNRCRNIADLFSDEISRDAARGGLLRKPTSHPTAPKRKVGTSRTGAMGHMLDDVVLDIRRRSGDVIDITHSRPLDSHAPSPSTPARHSFIDLLSPTAPAFPTMLPGGDTPANTHPSSFRPPRTVFSIPASFKPAQARSPSRGASPHQNSSDRREDPPPTTNLLHLDERADLVKKSRKLARVFGETPGGEMLSTQESSYPATSNRLSKPRRGRAKKETSHTTPLHLPPHAANRRHSIPVTPDEFSESFNQALFQSVPYRARLGLNTQSTQAFRHAVDHQLGSRISFIDLSDEDADEDALSPITFAPNSTEIASCRPPSPSQLSLYEAMTPEQRAEEQRRRKREKLAKLHRFLGSRVPLDLVLGVGHPESSLPPIQPNMPVDESESRAQWLRRRRSSSAGALPSWSDDVDRMKEELNDKEKAINVRRAQKMEKMFGVAPPQTLYHTRHSPSPSVPAGVYLKQSKSPPKPSFGDFIPPGEVPSPTYQQRNPNRSSYIKHRYRKNDRPSTAESSRRLLSEGPDCYSYDESPVIQASLGTSLVYHHYQHSLKSLSDILDRDDKESLAELHQYLNDFEDTTPTLPTRETPMMKDRRLSNASSIKSERRRSLPVRTSMLSITSGFSITTPKPEVSDFQVRRRRAAKLTQFFGVNYRELINDVLESLETGLEHERKRGTLRAEEVEDLLERLRRIKSNRKGFF